MFDEQFLKDILAGKHLLAFGISQETVAYAMNQANKYPIIPVYK